MNICLIHKGKSGTSGILKYFENSKYSVQEICLQELGGLNQLQKITADVVIFDVVSTNGDGGDFLLLQKIKETTKVIPVLLATNSNESSKYREKMLDTGVDGCIQIPFLQEELFLRIEKLASKKNSLLFSGTKIGAHHVEMDIRNHIVETEGEKVFLTKTEYSILFHLFLHKETVVTSKDLFRCLDEEAKENSLALNIHIFNLRKKIKDMRLIRTVPLYGFTVSDVLVTG